MVITDTYLENIAKALNSESYDVVSHLAITSDVGFTANTSAVNIGTELGTRVATSNTRVDNVVTFSAIRSGVDVIDTVNGDTLTGFGNFSASTGDNCQINISLPSINQTTGFDIEFDVQLTTNRR